MSTDDVITATLRLWAPPPAPRLSVLIGDTRLVFPAGTTREHAEAVLAEAKLVYLVSLRDYHDPGDEDRDG